MRFFNFHLMPWPHLPKDYDGPAWVKCPNALGHLPILEQPSAFLEHVRPFLAGEPPR